MPRRPKPYFRRQTQRWYCSISGRQISLGQAREAAFQKFHELMANRDQISQERTTLYELSLAYLDWCEKNRKPATYRRAVHYLRSFIESVGKKLRPSQLKQHQVIRWHEGLGVGSTSQNDAVTTIQRMLNWSVEQDYIDRNPVAGMRKPKRRRRDVFYAPEQWKLIKQYAEPPFDDLLDFSTSPDAARSRHALSKRDIASRM